MVKGFYNHFPYRQFRKVSIFETTPSHTLVHSHWLVHRPIGGQTITFLEKDRSVDKGVSTKVIRAFHLLNYRLLDSQGDMCGACFRIFAYVLRIVLDFSELRTFAHFLQFSVESHQNNRLQSNVFGRPKYLDPQRTKNFLEKN